MAIAATVPVVWGVATGHMEAASWIALAAECICWVELKGSFAQRMRVLAGGSVLAFAFALLGSLSGGYLFFSVVAMIFVGFAAGLFKNLGDRGAGLAVCVQVMFVITNAYPTESPDDLRQRLFLILIGGAWTMLTGLGAVVFTPAQQPYRRTIALIWRANSNLATTITRGWDALSPRSSLRDTYQSEKDVRAALDTSFHFFETMAHQQSEKEQTKFQLAQIRKAAALVASNMIAMAEELESVKIKDVHDELRIKLHNMLRALGESLERMGSYMVNLKTEEELLIRSRLLRSDKMITLLKEYKTYDEVLGEATAQRVIQLAERTVKLMRATLERLETMGEDLPVFRSYSLIKTLLILHPKHWVRNLRLLLNFQTNNARYAARSALAAGLALFCYKYFEIDHGYWLPFTVLIVIQPYFTATITKAVDRVIGTLTGGLVGGLMIRLPSGIYAKEIMLFICFLFMVYFIRRRYSVAVFFITVSVVLLFDVEAVLNPMIIVIRALCTIGGAVLGITAGFALLPNWDKKQLPQHITDALGCNYQYFLASFFQESRPQNWTRNKRSAEGKNSNAYDSFSRYMQEPGGGNKSLMMTYYQLINHSVRITRELNNIHLEQEQDGEAPAERWPQQQLVSECLEWFNKVVERMALLHPPAAKNLQQPEPRPEWSYMSLQQKIYLEKLLIELKALYQDLGHMQRIAQ